MQSEEKHTVKTQDIIASEKKSVPKYEATSVLNDKENDEKEKTKTSATERGGVPNEVLRDLNMNADEIMKKGIKFIIDEEKRLEGMKEGQSQRNMTEEIKVCSDNTSTDDGQKAEEYSEKKLFATLLKYVADIDEIAQRENIDLS